MRSIIISNYVCHINKQNCVILHDCHMDIHFSYFFNRKLKDITPPTIKKWQNVLFENYSSAYIRNIYGLFH
ncbi:hypothetical protein [Ornithinibacillus sp. FSL M8-0202]|uniref:hypothetical protein n=1 Tax=Ornithinibacillus sp. FSL M8-0202 TaxID=2921616 RepID=UPI0030D46388